MNDEIIFAPEGPPKPDLTEGFWKLLIVDDEPDVHVITKKALDQLVYKNKNLIFFDAYTANEAEKIMQTESDIAIVMLDVVMETVHAGLDLIRIIREAQRNCIVRIILRTGQAGQAPEKEVISAYEIDDYKMKTELTSLRLYTIVMAGLRTYEALSKLQAYGTGLEKEVEARTAEIRRKNTELTDSIRYASYIQSAIFPSEQEILTLFPESFILNIPRDIISGDFYWYFRREDKIFFAVGDCTGHGVPGALMCMLGISFLNEIVTANKYIAPGEILNELKNKIIQTLHQKQNFERQPGQTIKDGMDIALCCYKHETMELQYSGANNSLYLIQSVASQPIELKEIPVPSLVEVKPDRMPVGFSFTPVKSFKTQSVSVADNDCLFLMSDGYADQFGGPDNSKFKKRRLKELLIAINSKEMPEQKKDLKNAFLIWKGNLEQIDDVMIMGIRL